MLISNVDVTDAARLNRAASVLTAELDLVLLTPGLIMLFPEAPHSFASFPNYRVTSELLEGRQNFLSNGKIATVVVVSEVFTKIGLNVIDNGFLI